MRGDGARVLLDFVLEKFDGGFELSVVAFEGGVGKIVHGDVGVDAMAFDEPPAVGTIDAEFGSSGDSAVGEEVAGR